MREPTGKFIGGIQNWLGLAQFNNKQQCERWNWNDLNLCFLWARSSLLSKAVVAIHAAAVCHLSGCVSIHPNQIWLISSTKDQLYRQVFFGLVVDLEIVQILIACIILRYLLHILYYNVYFVVMTLKNEIPLEIWRGIRQQEESKQRSSEKLSIDSSVWY